MYFHKKTARTEKMACSFAYSKSAGDFSSFRQDSEGKDSEGKDSEKKVKIYFRPAPIDGEEQKKIPVIFKDLQLDILLKNPFFKGLDDLEILDNYIIENPELGLTKVDISCYLKTFRLPNRFQMMTLGALRLAHFLQDEGAMKNEISDIPEDIDLEEVASDVLLILADQMIRYTLSIIGFSKKKIIKSEIVAEKRKVERSLFDDLYSHELKLYDGNPWRSPSSLTNDLFFKALNHSAKFKLQKKTGEVNEKAIECIAHFLSSKVGKKLWDAGFSSFLCKRFECSERQYNILRKKDSKNALEWTKMKEEKKNKTSWQDEIWYEYYRLLEIEGKKRDIPASMMSGRELVDCDYAKKDELWRLAESKVTKKKIKEAKSLGY